MGNIDDYRRHLKTEIDDCFIRKDDKEPQKRFASSGATREIFKMPRLFKLVRFLIPDRTEAELNKIAERIRGPEGSARRCNVGYNNVLATLLYAHCEDQTLRKFVECLLLEACSNPNCDGEMPFTEARATEAFGDADGKKFCEQQYLFSPIVLEEQKEVIYTDHRNACPAPFTEEPDEIRRGAYGIVYKVTIEKGHLINEKGANDRNQYAMKKFTDYITDAEAKESFTKERSTIKQFIQCAKSHSHIATTKASLEWCNSYSLFFDLAKCNLSDYLENSVDTMNILEDKQRILSQTIGLAGALGYLHDDLYLEDTNEQLQCYHLDLKPQNILIFESNGKEVWKISDFGISQIKRFPAGKPKSEPHTASLDTIFRPKKSVENPSSGVDNPRYGGTYSAPEAQERASNVTRKSDVWSLACIITLVLTFIYKQSSGIKEFQQDLAKDRTHDWFFDSKAFESKAENILHPAVLHWLDTLKQQASRRHHSESKATEMATDLLKRNMFLRDPRKRLSAKEVEGKLVDIRSRFTQEPNLRPSWRDRPNPFPRKVSDSKKKGQWSFEILPSFKRCKFSADGSYLCIASDIQMAIQPISRIRSGHALSTDKSFQLSKDRKCAHFSLGSKYLCAVVESEYFEFSYLPLSTEESKDRFDACEEVRCRIKRAVISPDDTVTAFVLQEFRNGQKISSLALYNTRDLLDTSTSSMASDNTNGSSSRPRYSNTATSQDLPWKNIIARPEDSALPDGVQLVDLRFSGNSKVLMGVTEPFNHSLWQYDIMSWDVTTGRKLPTVSDYTKGYDRMGDTWAVEAFAAFSNQPSFVSISKRKLRRGRYDPPGYQSKSRIISEELQDILITNDEDELVLIAQPSGKSRFDAFRVPTSKIQDLESLGQGWQIGSRKYNRTTDCCCLLESEGKLAVMVALIDSKDRRGTLFEKVCEIP